MPFFQRILADGWKTGLSAGSDVLKAMYGLAVPGIYVGGKFSVALTYPLTSTTTWAPVRGSVNAGTVQSTQHSSPLRITFRAVGGQ